MMKKMMVRCALLGAAALLVAACFDSQDYKSEYDYQLLVQFEPDEEYQWDDFVRQFFNNGEDTVSFNPSISIGPVYHFAKISDLDGFQGGIALARGKDTDASPDRKPSYFAVYDEKYGDHGSHGYAVFHDTTDALMPEHEIQIAFANAQCYCEAKIMYVHNVQAAYQAAKHGVGLVGGPFTDADNLIMTVSGYKGSALTGQVDVKLINGTNAIVEWTKVDLTSLGKVDAIDFHLTSSRPDFPLYCCVDNMGYHYYEITQ